MTDNKLRGHIACPTSPPEFKFSTDGLIQKIVTEMNFRNGYIHLECFIDKNGFPTVGEFGWRTAGHRIIDNHSYVRGFDIHDALLDIITGTPAKIPESNNSVEFIGNTFLPKKPGIITDIMSQEDILLQDGVFKTELFPKIGQKSIVNRKSSETAGYAFVKGDSIFSVENRMQKVFNDFYKNFHTITK